MAVASLEKIQGITIPTKKKDISKVLEDLDDLVRQGVELSYDEKWWYEKEKKNKKLEEQEKAIANLQMKYNTPLIYKMRQKMTKTYDKYLANGQWFKESMKMFKSMGQKAGNWLMDILKIIFLLAIFDPKGKFLNSIVDFILKMVIWFVDILIKFLPKIIKIMIFLITDVIPKVLKKIVNVISDYIYKVMGEWTDSLPEGPMKNIMNWIREGFGEKGIIREFFSTLAGWFPQFLILLAGLKAMSIIMPILNAAYTAGKLIVGAYTAIMEGINLVMMVSEATGMGFAASLWALVAPMIAAALPIILVVAAIVALIAIFYLLYKHWDKVKEFFSWLGEKISVGVKWLWDKIKIGAELFYKFNLPLRIFVAGIKGLINMFKSFKKIGIGATFKAMGEGVKNLAKGAKDFMSSKISEVWTGIKNLVKSAWEGAKNVGNTVINFGKDLWDSLLNSSFGKWITKVLDTLSLDFHQFLAHPFGYADKNMGAWIGYQQLTGQTQGHTQKELEDIYSKMSDTEKLKFRDEAVKLTGKMATDIVSAVNDLIEAGATKKEKEVVSTITYVDKTKRWEVSEKAVGIGTKG